ncbi:DNA replication protein [Burkholderia lata]|nr:DNA replication protein [Burkholderia lata]
MAKAEREGNLAQRVRFLARNSLLIVDEIGYLPIGSNGGNLFFQLVNACYERCAIILTSNRSFGEWGEVFGDSVVAAVLLDRLLHHAIVVQIEGTSYRLREHADLLPDHLHNRSSSLNHAPAEPDRRRPGRPRRSSSDHITG